MSDIERRIPFLRPRPARLSGLLAELEAIEAAGWYSNFGPLNRRLESALTERVWGGQGGAVTCANATLGLMLAIREAVGPGPAGRFALMPSFTFAATAHATAWAGLTPLFCDIEEATWVAAPDAEDELLALYGERIACIVPYACFGTAIDLDRYARLARERSVGVVVDAAASLGTLDDAGRGFGAGFPGAVVLSMHATKLFATAEGGIIHSGDRGRLDRLRAMSDFGFETARVATMPGLNAKLSEVIALLGLAKLDDLDRIATHREGLASTYRALLPELCFQQVRGTRVAYQFMPTLLPRGWGPRRDSVITSIEAAGIGCRRYFSPHLWEQPWFAANAVAGDLGVTDDIASRVISLPMADDMTHEEVAAVCEVVRAVMRRLG
jgi:dTDP-4-amino-4,6-dideoxygalactose transaminase